MNEHAIRILEFNKIITMLADETSNTAGRSLAEALTPMDNLDMIRDAQTNTSDAFTRIVKRGSISSSSVGPVESALKRLAVDAVLNTAELLNLACLMEAAAAYRNYGKPLRDDEPADSLTEYFMALMPMSNLSGEIRRCIPGIDEISDDASPTLRSIRRQIESNKSRIHSTLNSMVNGSYRTYLQDPVVTMRNNRYCLPVKAEYKSQVQGLVHDQSQSGMTLFIEPMSVVNLNNDIKELEIKEQEEIRIILKDLSIQAAQHADGIRSNYELLGLLDFIMAKGQLALKMNASMPIFNDEGRINIRKGRHPLLDPASVVPIDLKLGEDFTLLVVTGPNTGGKTVSLKTAGLFTLMGEAGLHIPAGERSELALFPEVYADIGDEQSIEQSLSTFSGHMTNIVRILGEVEDNALVLFDELGAGTDPTEGAALAMAILQNLHERDIRCIATTHYSELKVYALTTPGVSNASCEFDVETLRPTYRILIGVPGKSNAFAISSKLGLSDDIIDNARLLLDAQDVSFEDLMTDLESRRIKMESERLEFDREKQDLERLKAQLARDRKQLDERKDSIIQKAQREAAAILKDAKDYADETIKNFHKFGKANISSSELEKEREKLRKKLDKTKTAGSGIKTESHKLFKPGDFKVGDSVKVHSMNVKGIVQKEADSNGNLYVQMGVIKSRVHYSDLTLLAEDNPYASGSKSSGRGKGSGASGIKMSKSMVVGNEISLRGMTVDEALAVLDKYLDDAYLARKHEVRIVHGKGTGALRSAVHQYLRANLHVKEFRLGAFGEGDAGVTIATFTD